jgi:hypothetical protein
LASPLIYLCSAAIPESIAVLTLSKSSRGVLLPRKLQISSWTWYGVSFLKQSLFSLDASTSMQNPEVAYHQRIQTIVTSYNLAECDDGSFEAYLTALMGQVPVKLLELAIVETLVRQWLKVPFERGVRFLEQTQNLLSTWQMGQFECHLTPFYFEMLTGLDANPVFDGLELALREWVSVARVRAMVHIPATETP